MAWDSIQETGDKISAGDWNTMVTYIKSIPTEPYLETPLEIFDTEGHGAFCFDYNSSSNPSVSILIGNSNSNRDFLIRANSGVNGQFIRFTQHDIYTGSPLVLSNNMDNRINPTLPCGIVMDFGPESPENPDDFVLTDYLQFRFWSPDDINYEMEISAKTSSVSDANLCLTPCGSGHLKFGTYVATPVTSTGYIEILDSNGDLRLLMVGELPI